MRPQVPPLPKERPTNPRDSLAGRWYANINTNNKDENTNENNSQNRLGIDEQVMKRSQRYGYEIQQDHNIPNTLGDFVLNNHQVLDQFDLRYENLPQGYKAQQQSSEPCQYRSIKEELTIMPSISSNEDMIRAGMHRPSGTQLSGTSPSRPPSTPVPGGLQPSEYPSLEERQGLDFRTSTTNNNKTTFMEEHEQKRRPRSRSPAPDVAFLRRYRQQTRDRAEESVRERECQGISKTEGWDQQRVIYPAEQQPQQRNHSIQNTNHHGATQLPPRSLSSSDRQASGNSSGQLSSETYPVYQRHLNPKHTSSYSSSSNSHKTQKTSKKERTSIDYDVQRYSFENGRVFPQSRSQHTSKLRNESKQICNNSQNSFNISNINRFPWNGRNAINFDHDDPIDIERQKHAEEEKLWNVGNQMQIVQEARQSQRYDISPRTNRSQEQRHTSPNFEEPDPIFETRIEYFDDGIVLQPSAFDTLTSDGYRVFPNRALADANESLASTLQAVDHNYQHPYAYRPTPERSINTIQCNPNPTPVSPMNEQSPSAAMTSLVEKGKSMLSLLGPNIIPRGCAPIGQLSEAIAAEEDDKVKGSFKSLWAFLDPNNDLSGYDDGSSFGSSERRSPRKHRSTRIHSNCDDEISDSNEDRYILDEYPTKVRSNAPRSAQACQKHRNSGEVENDTQHKKHTYRTKITVQQKNVSSDNQQHGVHQTIYTGQNRTNESDPFDDVNQDEEGDPFIADFEPFEESVHEAIWGSEESPDPIFSSSDPRNMREKKNGAERHSTGGIGKEVTAFDGLRRKSGPTPRSNQPQQRPKSAGRATRELGISTKQNHPIEKNSMNYMTTRSQSSGRGSRVENFLQRLTGQNENRLNEDEQPKQITKQRRRSRSASDLKGAQRKRKDNDDGKADDRRRSRSGSNRDSQRSRNTLPSDGSSWEGVDNFEQNIEKLLSRRQNKSSAEESRVQRQHDQVRKGSFANAERLQSFGIDQIGRSKRSFSNRALCKVQSPGREKISHRLDKKVNDTASPQEVPWRMHEERDGHYMYVAYSRFDDDAQQVLQLCEHQSLPQPNARNGEVMIRVEASVVSSSDCAIRRGEWATMSLNPYIIPGIAMVGRVYSDGRKNQKRHSSFSFSSPIKPGDVVMSLMTSGGNARYTCLPKAQLVKVPPKVSLDKAVCLVENYLTAFQVLHMGLRGKSRYQEYSLDGRSILVLGGYSALGKALIELSIVGGAEYCYASACQSTECIQNGNSASAPSARRQFEVLAQWGAIPLSSDPQDWLTLIGRQIDLIVTIYDPSDQALYNEIVSDDHCKALRKDGQIVVICTHPGVNKDEEHDDVFVDRPRFDRHNHNNFRIPTFRTKPRDRFFEERTVWYNLFDSWERTKPDRYGNVGKAIAKKDLEHLLELLQQDRLHPEVLECIPLSKVGKAQFILEHKRLAGHLVCVPWMKQTSGKKGRGKMGVNEHSP
ncbi:alcohol dehydrogenase [Nitzschia inconspicua]|uniref:Alcohol dehydrogenase n=1 Tax=Nitzschia inconspicua TaxID=303405 RepID=A0A9K3PAQ5_9STRA|nr:alcohol dehydrogenase [Nitzschia inconspicua]